MKLFALLVAAGWLGVCLGGCHLIFPFDASGAVDGDGPFIPWTEGSVREGGILSEQATGLDLSKKDAATADADTQGQDLAGLDLPVKPVDAGLQIPCVAGGQLKMKYASNMIQCSYSGKVLSQCDAVNYCNSGGGWSLCTAAQYQARGGKVQIPPNEAAWIAACVRQGGSPGSPLKIPGICPTCDTATPSSVLISWTCTAGDPFLVSAYAYVGVHSYGQCLRLGENDPATEANWRAAGTMSPLKSALCCK